MRCKHHRRHQGRFTRLASLAPSLTASAAVRLLLAAALVFGLAVTNAAAQTVTLSVPSGTSVEEGAGSVDVPVTATLSASRSSATTITLSLGGTARPSDYTLLSLPDIEIPPGATTGDATVIVSPVDDTFWEMTETVEVTGLADGLMVTGASFDIDDDETEPTLTLATSDSLFLYEGDSANVTFVIGLGGALLETDLVGQIDIDYYIAQPADFMFPSPPPWSFTIPAGRVSSVVQVAVTAVDDTERERSEQSLLLASAPIHATTLESIPVTGFHIGRSDSPIVAPSFELLMTPLRVQSGESTTVTVTASVSVALDEPLSFTVNPASDFSTWFSPSHHDVTLPPGTKQASVEFVVTPPALAARKIVPILADLGAQRADIEWDFLRQRVDLIVWSAGVPQLRGFRTVSRLLAGGDGIYLAGGEIGIAAYFSRPFSLTGDAALSVRLDSGVKSVPCRYNSQVFISLYCEFSIQNGDYDFDSFLEIAPGGLSVTGWRDRDDALVTWPPPHIPAVPARVSIQYPIYGGTAAIDLQLTIQSVQEGAGATSVTVIASRPELVRRMAPQEVPIRFTNSTTTDGDYTVSGPQSITIPAGQVEGRAVFAVTAVEDFVKEARIETVRIEGDTARTSISVRGVDLQIVDAPSIALSVSPGSVTEAGGAQMVTVTAALADPTDAVRPRPIPVTLTWAGTAGAGDYAAAGALEVTIPGNARSGSTTLTLTPVNDRLLEGDETIVVRGATQG